MQFATLQFECCIVDKCGHVHWNIVGAADQTQAFHTQLCRTVRQQVVFVTERIYERTHCFPIGYVLAIRQRVVRVVNQLD